MSKTIKLFSTVLDINISAGDACVLMRLDYYEEVHGDGRKFPLSGVKTVYLRESSDRRREDDEQFVFVDHMQLLSIFRDTTLVMLMERDEAEFARFGQNFYKPYHVQVLAYPE